MKQHCRRKKFYNIGPRSVKWDFTENLIPTSSPSLEEETFRIMPGLRGKLHGMCVYVPTPEVKKALKYNSFFLKFSSCACSSWEAFGQPAFRLSQQLGNLLLGWPNIWLTWHLTNPTLGQPNIWPTQHLADPTVGRPNSWPTQQLADPTVGQPNIRLT